MSDPSSDNTKLPDPVEANSFSSGLLRGFIGTAKTVLFRPRTFFPTMPVEGGLLGPYVFFLLCTSIFFGVTLGVNMVAAGGFDYRILPMLLVALCMPFVSSGIIFFVLTRVFNTTGSYEASFRVVCYASAVNLLAWIPLVGFIGQFYEIYLSTLGLAIVHRTTMLRALVAVVATALAVFLAVIYFAELLMAF
ncbi:MAG: YIP1 family protein [Deltaproteobacteria bacterium]|nr:YIP1 family protein [Deltaproteobacteria bacterium]MBW2071968.1 YIP1 family protein [Deltaproteobacteria bacterium]